VPGRDRPRRERSRQVRLADERDRVDADLFAAQVVAVRLAHGTQHGLGDLSPTADILRRVRTCRHLIEALRQR